MVSKNLVLKSKNGRVVKKSYTSEFYGYKVTTVSFGSAIIL